MNLELDLYPIISNKIIRQKDWKSIKEHKPGFWSRKDIEGNRLVHTQRGYFLNNKNISVTSAQSFIYGKGHFVVRNCDRFAWIRAGKIPQEAFSAWSKEAQKEKVKCENGEINQKIFAMAEAVTT